MSLILKNLLQEPQVKVSGPYHFTGLLKSITFLHEGHSILLLIEDVRNFFVNDSKSVGISSVDLERLDSGLGA